jgi:RNA polymerase sigma-70 factor (ECF subfamily)
MDRLRVIPVEGSPGVMAGMSDRTASFEEFFALERDHLYGVLVLITGDRHEAEDLAQDAFATIWERWDRVGVMENPAGYLHRTAVNAFRKRLRRDQILVRLVPFLTPGSASGPADSGLMIAEALRSLTPRQRAALVLTELLGYTAAEAADMLGVRPSTIAALRHQGRAALKKKSEPSDD